MKLGPLTLFCCSLLGACASAHADPTAPQVYRGGRWEGPGARVSPRIENAAYRAEVVDAAGNSLPLYRWEGQSFVLGQMGSRYRIHVTNRTSRRVEAVVSVDGLEVVGGRPADLQKARGYILPPFGDITIDGFRTSLDEVAAFRFSTVREAYATRKGDDRNVGVIGVAFFPERERYAVLAPPPPRVDWRGRRDASEESHGSASSGPLPSAAPATQGADSAPAPSAAGRRAEGGSPRDAAKKAERPGLGTEFGERHESSVRYASFERESSSTPASVLELHYNDRAGLRAMGIPIDPPYEATDYDLRRSAEPFPATRFAAPPPGDR
jgi:hypothetical protein